MKEYFGKYRAIVTNNNDPEKQGRIKVQVPFISGNSVIGWCLPCVPVAYAKGGDYNIPKVGSFVWVEFEHGDVRYPIYTGSIYGANNTPLDDVGTRLISWGNCSIQMSQNALILKCGNNVLKLTPTDIDVQGSISATNVKATSITTNSLSAQTSSLGNATANTVSASGNISAGGTVSGSNI